MNNGRHRPALCGNSGYNSDSHSLDTYKCIGVWAVLKGPISYWRGGGVWISIFFCLPEGFFDQLCIVSHMYTFPKLKQYFNANIFIGHGFVK